MKNETLRQMIQEIWEAAVKGLHETDSVALATGARTPWLQKQNKTKRGRKTFSKNARRKAIRLWRQTFLKANADLHHLLTSESLTRRIMPPRELPSDIDLNGSKE